MTDILFRIKSDAPYTQEELEGLSDELADAAKKNDDDIDVSSAEIEIVDPEAGSAAEQVTLAKAKELIADGVIEVVVNIRDKDLSELHEVKLSTEQ